MAFLPSGWRNHARRVREPPEPDITTNVGQLSPCPPGSVEEKHSWAAPALRSPEQACR